MNYLKISGRRQLRVPGLERILKYRSYIRLTACSFTKLARNIRGLGTVAVKIHIIVVQWINKDICTHTLPVKKFRTPTHACVFLFTVFYLVE